MQSKCADEYFRNGGACLPYERGRVRASPIGQRELAEQILFDALRDISHTHQHHTPSSDTILILQYRRETPRTKL
jgi:hypothetical protein